MIPFPRSRLMQIPTGKTWTGPVWLGIHLEQLIGSPGNALCLNLILRSSVAPRSNYYVALPFVWRLWCKTRPFIYSSKFGNVSEEGGGSMNLVTSVYFHLADNDNFIFRSDVCGGTLLVIAQKPRRFLVSFWALSAFWIGICPRVSRLVQIFTFSFGIHQIRTLRFCEQFRTETSFFSMSASSSTSSNKFETLNASTLSSTCPGDEIVIVSFKIVVISRVLL